jgi:hypothetical protein
MPAVWFQGPSRPSRIALRNSPYSQLVRVCRGRRLLSVSSKELTVLDTSSHLVQSRVANWLYSLYQSDAGWAADLDGAALRFDWLYWSARHRRAVRTLAEGALFLWLLVPWAY